MLLEETDGNTHHTFQDHFWQQNQVIVQRILQPISVTAIIDKNDLFQQMLRRAVQHAVNGLRALHGVQRRLGSDAQLVVGLVVAAEFR